MQIRTEAPGLIPEQVERLVTQPVENAVIGVVGIETLRSSSAQGLSVITATFETGSDIYHVRQEIAERLADAVDELPAGFPAPLMLPLTSSTSIVLAVGLTSASHSVMDLTTIAQWTVTPALLAVPGVAKSALFGSEVKELQVQFRPDRLAALGLSVKDVLGAASRATGVRGAGFIDTRNQRVLLRTEGQSTAPEQLAGTVLGYHDGAVVTLGAVAEVTEAPEPPNGAAAVMGRPGVMLMVSSQYGSNTLEVTRGLDRALASLRPALAADGVDIDASIFRPADFIMTAVHHVRTALILGAVLVIVVLFLFLLNLRTAAISCTAIPLSLLAAVAVLDRMGLSLNTLTLGGLAIAIGEVVDDAVIDVENVLRRLRENRSLERPRPVLDVVLDASIEVRSAVVYATFAVALVFLPVLTMTGVAGRLFAPLGIAYILAIMASLVVALTVTPALCLTLLGGWKMPEKEPKAVSWLKGRYQGVLRRVERAPRLVVGGAAALTLVALVLIFSVEGEFLPELGEGHFIIHMAAVPGTSIDESLRLGGRVTEELRTIPSVRTIGQRVGRTVEGDDVMGTHSSEIEIGLAPDLSARGLASAKKAIRGKLAAFAGVRFEMNTFLNERIEEILSGFKAPVVVSIFGSDLGVIDGKAQEVARVLRSVRGAADVEIKSPPGTPEVEITLRSNDLVRWGLDPVEALDAVRTAYQGDVVGQAYEGNRVFDVVVILPPALRASVAAIGALPLRNAAGTYVRLDRVADVAEGSARYVVLHEGARRVQAVTCDVTGRSVGAFVREAKDKMASTVTFPANTYPEFSGTAEAEALAKQQLIVHSLMAALGIVILLYIDLRRMRNLMLILANLPFALAGGILAVVFTGTTLSIGAMVGFVTLFGITLRNSVMMITHYQHLVAREGMTWGSDAALRGASERLTPILMTASVTALGLLPMALRSGAPGLEIEGPMAIVILGGLVSSTALNLLVLPTLSLKYGKFAQANAIN